MVKKLIDVNKKNGIKNEKFYENQTISYANYIRDDYDSGDGDEPKHIKI